MITAANIPAQSPVYFMELIIPQSPGATGFSGLSELAKISDRKILVPDINKLKIVTVTIPGCAWET